MYGIVNKALREMVLDQQGPEAWEAVRAQAGAPENFDPFEQFDDAITYGLVGATEAVLKMPAEKVLFSFGEYWVSAVAVGQYPEIMEKAGTDFISFVTSLDALHARISGLFPDYVPPSFRVADLTGDKFQLDYYSEREGLLVFVEGLLHGLAAHFNVTIQIEHVPDDQHAMPCKRMEVSYSSGECG